MPLRSAVVGAGVVSETHLTALDRHPRTDLHAICDVDSSKATEVGRNFGIRSFVDLEEMLDSVDLNWVHICTPVDTHAALARDVIERGIPVMVEKPITKTSEELAGLRRVADEHGVPVSSVHNHVFDPVMRRARKRIDRGHLGTIRGVDLLYTGETKPDEKLRGSWTFDLPGGEFEEGLPHPIYIALAVGGYPADDTAVQIQTGLADSYDDDFAYDSVQIQFQTETGALSSIKILSGGLPQRSLYIHGEHESLIADLISQTLIRIPRDYTVSSVARARNNTDRAVDRLRGTAENLWAVLSNKIDDDWENAMRLNSHYYQIDLEATALLTGRDLPIPFEQVEWTIRLMEQIRETALIERDEVDSAIEPMS